jgi:hypothetical protein
VNQRLVKNAKDGGTFPVNKRVDIRAILRNPAQRRELMIRCIIATQAREDVQTTYKQAAVAYDKVSDYRKSNS